MCTPVYGRGALLVRLLYGGESLRCHCSVTCGAGACESGRSGDRTERGGGAVLEG